MDPLTMGAIGALAEFAPQLVRWLTGNDKAGKVAEVAVDIAKKVTGKDTPDAAVAAIKADPNLIFQYQQAVLQADTKLQEAYLADMDSARKMQIAALQQDDVFSKRFIYYFSGAWSAFAMVYMLWVTFGSVKQENLANIILGFLLGTAVSAIFSFFYGTTVRSQSYQSTIDTLLKGK